MPRTRTCECPNPDPARFVCEPAGPLEEDCDLPCCERTCNDLVTSAVDVVAVLLCMWLLCPTCKCMLPWSYINSYCSRLTPACTHQGSLHVPCSQCHLRGVSGRISATVTSPAVTVCACVRAPACLTLHVPTAWAPIVCVTAKILILILKSALYPAVSCKTSYWSI